MDLRMQDLLATLGTVSKINSGDKLIVRSKYIGIDRRWFQRLQRFMDGECRESTINRLTEIYREVQEKINIMLLNIDNHKKNENKNLNDIYRTLNSTVMALKRSNKGIQNLIQTYNLDSSIVSRLESIRDIYIHDIYNEVYKFLPLEYKPEEYKQKDFINTEIYSSNELKEC